MNVHITCTKAFFALLLLSTPVFGQRADSFPLADMTAQVKKELAAAQDTPGQVAGSTLQTVQINFALTPTTDVNGKVAIGVPVLSADLGANGERKAEDTSSLTVELAPPAASITMSGTDSSQVAITQTIVAIRKQLASGLNDEPKLDPEKVTFQLDFGLTRTGGGTGQIKFLICTVGGVSYKVNCGNKHDHT